MAHWLQNQLKAAEGLLEAVDRTAKVVKETTSSKNLLDGTPGTRWMHRFIHINHAPHSQTTSTAESIGAPASQPPAPPLPSKVCRYKQRGYHVTTTHICTAIPTCRPPTGTGRATTATRRNAAANGAPKTHHCCSSSASKASNACPTDHRCPKYRCCRCRQRATTSTPCLCTRWEDGKAIASTKQNTRRHTHTHLTAAAATASQADVLPTRVDASVRAVVDVELDEARALAESAPQGAREGRLQRVVERLKSRLEQYRVENQQLEEMLQAADARYTGGAGALEAAHAALAAAEAAHATAEAARVQAVAAHDADVAHLEAKLQEATERQRVLEGEVEALQASCEALEAQHTADETSLLHTLRAEAVALEQRLKEEQTAHAASIHQVLALGDALCVTLYQRMSHVVMTL